VCLGVPCLTACFYLALCPPTEKSTQEPAQPISAEFGPLNAATSCGGDILGVNTTVDEATKPPAIVLSAEQTNILEKVEKSGNVFFTGPAG